MKIIPENEVDEVAGEYSDSTTSCGAYLDFKAGVTFAESKFQELAIEFIKYSARYGLYHIIHTDGKESFKQFVKERNEIQTN